MSGDVGQAGRHDTPRGAGANDNHIVPHQVRSSLARHYRAMYHYTECDKSSLTL